MRTNRGLKAIGVAALMSASAYSWAIPMTTVGALDEFVASANLKNSGDDTELAWAIEKTGNTNLVIDGKYNTGFANFQLVDGTADTYATALSDSPDYFLVKIGNTATGGPKKSATPKDVPDTFLFKNLSELAYGVFTLASLGITADNITKISHLTLFDDPTVEVAEPGVISMLALGLLGLGWSRRKAS